MLPFQCKFEPVYEIQEERTTIVDQISIYGAARVLSQVHTGTGGSFLRDHEVRLLSET